MCYTKHILIIGSFSSRRTYIRSLILIGMSWGFPKKNTINWKKQVVDALCHDPKAFLSGKEEYSKRGFWGLKNIHEDPWNPSKIWPTQLPSFVTINGNEDDPIIVSGINEPVHEPNQAVLPSIKYILNEQEDQQITLFNWL